MSYLCKLVITTVSGEKINSHLTPPLFITPSFKNYKIYSPRYLHREPLLSLDEKTLDSVFVILAPAIFKTARGKNIRFSFDLS